MISNYCLRYLSHGMIISKIHMVLEYCSAKVFEPFVKKCVRLRRLGDVDPSQVFIYIVLCDNIDLSDISAMHIHCCMYRQYLSF